MTEEIKDNRLMVDNNTAQKITAAEIDQMKRENVGESEIERNPPFIISKQ